MNPVELRRLVLRESKRAHVGHIGSSLSVVEIVAALYGGWLRVDHVHDPERDRMILSKGHAALALYCAFHLRGWLTQAELAGYCQDGGLGVHPELGIPGVDFSTGSLGQGLSMGAGAALAARLDGSPRRVVVLVSDAEHNEGSLWEAAAFAAHQRLDNLVAIVDCNGQQALGHTNEVLDMSPLAERWRAFGWDATEVDGHDVAALTTALDRGGATRGRPHVIVARTVAGKGVSYMEGRVEWHYLPMDEAQYTQALREIGASA